MLKDLKKDIDKGLRDFAAELKNKYSIHNISPALHNTIKDFILRDGKRIRPILYLTAYLGYTKKKNTNYSKLIRSAISLELLHDFLLIHDDVIDKSDLRRGKPTAHRMFNKYYKTGANSDLGPNLSIVAGDIIYALSIDAFLSINEDPKRKEKALLDFTKAAIYTGGGEYIDVVNSIRPIGKIAERDIYMTYIFKTAKYTFEYPMAIGARLAGTPSGEIKKLSRLGILLGEAFQIQDDMLDIFFTSKEMGKSSLSDLEESKKTLLLWKAYNSLPSSGKRSMENLLKKPKKARKDLLLLKELIIRSNAHKYCIDTVSSLLDKAVSSSRRLKMKPDNKKAIEEILSSLISKNNKLTKRVK